ncbi:MAG: DUF1667 domain-containing protein [Clostridiales bacterium]|jgi:CxxC motif-containing protein|nr:DUF1667 domain-containing protein [Clostridiales bacterium]
MTKELICITCPNSCRISAELGENGTVSVSGNLCPRGEIFASNELTCPKRSLTTTVRTVFGDMPVLPVRTAGEIPKEMIMDAMAVLSGLVIRERVKCGDVVVRSILDTGCDVIATLDL